MAKKEKNIKEETIGISPLMAGVIGLLLGALGVYAFYTIIGSAGAADVTETENFTLDMEMVAELEDMMETMAYASTGMEIEMEYKSYLDKGNYVEILFATIQGDVPVYISKDYKYIYGGIYGFEEMKIQTDALKLQIEAMKEAENQGGEGSGMEYEKSEKPEVKLFLMSFCPFGNIAENGIEPVINLMGEDIEFEPVYIISGENGNYQSLHGAPELNQDIREKIIYNLYGAQMWMDYVYKVNAQCSLNGIEECWQGPAEELGINISEVEEIYETQFNEIADGEVLKTAEWAVRGSPTLYINNMLYNGQRDPESYKTAICSAFLSEPEACGSELSEEAVGPDGNC
ncbi:hypothetical protein KAW38_01090 [Candidatus Micrarchaeota archaeon]|nr:hypothetical protein [Candidatus Micrarchaeota archaeon]